jgi:hypothetical protein
MKPSPLGPIPGLDLAGVLRPPLPGIRVLAIHYAQHACHISQPKPVKLKNDQTWPEM